MQSFYNVKGTGRLSLLTMTKTFVIKLELKYLYFQTVHGKQQAFRGKSGISNKNEMLSAGSLII